MVRVSLRLTSRRVPGLRSNKALAQSPHIPGPFRIRAVNKTIRVLLCDDQPSIRAHLRKALAGAQGIEVVGEAAGGRVAVRMARELLPDVVIMDISMPDLDGIQATRQIVAQVSTVKVMIFSAESNARTVQQALAAGASGFVVKSSNAEELIHALRTVMDGGQYLSPAIHAAALASQPPKPEPSSPEPQSNPQTPNPIRVVLLDDTAFVRERLAELLSALEGVQVVGQASDVPAASRLIKEFKPDVLVMDLELPGQSGMDLLASIGKDQDAPLIIILTNYDYPVLRQGCAKLGAHFYFYKPVEFERVIEVCDDLARRARRGRSNSPED